MNKDAGSITLNKLSKKYPRSDTFALKNVSLKVEAGEVYGFLGPNGSGKSTTIRIILNFLQPTSGTAKVLGKDSVEESTEIKRSVGYLSGDFAIYPKMKGSDYLSYMGELQPPISKTYVKELIKRFKAEPNKKLGELSRGNRQKFGIIQAFMHQPDVLILDEPTSGLDPLMQEEFYNLVAEAKQNGAAIFISSHIMSEVQKVCDRVGIIRDGKLIAELSISEMFRESAHTFEIVFEDRVPLSELKKIKNLKILEQDGQKITLHIKGKLAPLFAVLSRHVVSRIHPKSVDLDDQFLDYYREKGDKK